MKEYEELFQNYHNLGLDDKREFLNEELIKISYILKAKLNEYNQDLTEEPLNYKKGIDKDLDESDILDMNYRNIYNIKSELLLLTSLIDNRGVNNGD